MSVEEGEIFVLPLTVHGCTWFHPMRYVFDAFDANDTLDTRRPGFGIMSSRHDLGKSSLRGRCGTDGISDKLGLATQLHHECPRKPSTTAQRDTPDFQRFLLWSENGRSKNLSEVFPGKEDRGSSDTLAVAPDFLILRGFC